MYNEYHYHVVSCCLFEALAGASGVELSRTHSVGLDEDHHTAILIWPEEVGVARKHLVGHSADHECRMVWVVVAALEIAALLAKGTVLQYYLTFPALAATAGLAVVHHSAVIPILAVEFVLAWL